MGYDRSTIYIQRKSASYERKKDTKDERNLSFCYKMYESWTFRDTQFDIPILIMDNTNLLHNKDIYTIPRLYAKYIHKNVHIPFIYEDGKDQYVYLNKYFRTFLKKEIPSCEDFKELLLKKMMIDKYQSFYESVNLFLYTSFLLRQFACVMKIIPHFYSPISDETKYYFYMCVDFLRRKSIAEDKPFMKSQILSIISKLGTLHGIILNQKVFQKTFPFLEDHFFENEDSIFLQGNTPFSFSKE